MRAKHCFTVKTAAVLTGKNLKTEGKLAGLYTQTSWNERENLCAL